MTIERCSKLSGLTASATVEERILGQRDSIRCARETKLLQVASRAPRLCHRCRHILCTSKVVQRQTFYSTRSTRKKPKREIFQHYSTVSGLKQSALRNCHLFGVLYFGNRTIRSSDEFKTSKSPYSISLRAFEVFSIVEVRVEREETKNMVWITNTRPEALPYGRTTSDRTDSDEVFQLARSWLSKCLDNHGRCRTFSGSIKHYPRRLLRVDMRESNLYIRLCLTEEMRHQQPFLTLSHCWGKIKFVQLTRNTIQDFMDDTPIRLLPKTFRDAALIVNRLGYEYIWIDSLRILQDSVEDWKRELENMGEVFRNSVCTIAALGAEDSHGGCFFSRNVFSLGPWQLPNCGKRSLCAMHIYQGWMDMDPVIGPEPGRGSPPPLHRRAWVLQERTLSPRTLYYGSQMIFWECVSAKASEMQPQLFDLWGKNKMKEQGTMNSLVRNVNDVSELGMKARFATLLSICKDSDYSLWSNHWWKIVAQYTGCQMTFDRDKWPAISGLAKQLMEQSGRKMIYGLWQDFLVDELNWRALQPGRKLRTEAPSWSWLAIDARVGRPWKLTDDDSYESQRIATAFVSPTDLSTNISGKEQSVTTCGPILKFSWTKELRYQMCTGDLPLNYAFWCPDFVPDDGLSTYALQFGRHKPLRGLIFERELTWYSGLVITPFNPSQNIWVRVGAFSFAWDESRQRKAWHNTAPRCIGDIRTIHLV